MRQHKVQESPAGWGTQLPEIWKETVRFSSHKISRLGNRAKRGVLVITEKVHWGLEISHVEMKC